ncbi:MAG: DoxX family protein [Pseudomonadota bacterium]
MNALIKLFFTVRDKFTWLPLFIARISVGLFFAISGFNKLFVAANQKQILDTLIQAGIPLPHFQAIFVPAIEFIGGILLTLGIFSPIISIILFILIGVAIGSDAIHKIPAGLNFFEWLDYFIYLPEVLLAILLLFFIFRGAGCISFDALMYKNWIKKHNR